MRITGRFSRLAVAGVMTIATSVLTVGLLNMAPASAAGDACVAANDDGLICVKVSGGKVSGSATHLIGTFRTVNLRVYQCRPNFTGCGIIRLASGARTAQVSTTPAPAPAGHIFSACADWVNEAGQSFSNVCTKYRSSP